MENTIIWNGIHWKCISIFYNRQQWNKLLIVLRDFYKTYYKAINFIYYKFSTINGDRLDLILSVNETELSDKIIESIFFQFVKENPSDNILPEDWQSHVIWMPYDNNSVQWNKIHIPNIIINNTNYRELLNKQSVIGLLLTNYFHELYSILLFLNIQLLSFLIDNKIDIFPDKEENSSISLNIESLDCYKDFQPDETILYKNLSDLKQMHQYNYSLNALDYYLNIYISLRDQYCIDENGNKLLSDIVLNYYKNKLKNNQ